MKAMLPFKSGPRGATYWGIAWGIGVGIVEYLTVAPIDDWGSMRQLLFWLLYWNIPYWCVVGRLFVWLADHHERFVSRVRLLAVFIAFSGLAAALDPILTIELTDLLNAAFPQFDRYVAEFRIAEPNMGSFSIYQISLYQLWVTAFYGGLLMAARIFTVRVERTRHLLHASAMGRSRTEALIDAERLQALQSQIDPSLLLDSMRELEQRYRVNPERAERLLEALVEFLRYAMHGLRVPVSTLDAELQLARAFSQLQHERGVEGAWRIVEDPAPLATPFKFPSLLMLPLLALGGNGRPMLRIRMERDQAVLSLHGLSHSISAELRQQIRTRFYALYGGRFDFDCPSLTPRQVRITLPLTSTTPRV